jgi:hypothetical protein
MFIRSGAANRCGFYGAGDPFMVNQFCKNSWCKNIAFKYRERIDLFTKIPSTSTIFNLEKSSWVISPSQGLYLHTRQHKHRINACTQTSMPQVGFEPTTSVFVRSKIVHVSDRAVTVIELTEIESVSLELFPRQKTTQFCLLWLLRGPIFEDRIFIEKLPMTD